MMKYIEYNKELGFSAYPSDVLYVSGLASDIVGEQEDFEGTEDEYLDLVSAISWALFTLNIQSKAAKTLGKELTFKESDIPLELHDMLEIGGFSKIDYSVEPPVIVLKTIPGM